jgi:ABC-type uncharacterized transport system fused permease/ATPase subunit
MGSPLRWLRRLIPFARDTRSMLVKGRMAPDRQGHGMSDRPQHPGRPDSDPSTGSRLVPQVGMMLEAFWASSVRNTLLWLAGVIFLVVVATAYGQIRLNRWNQPFYDALSRRDFHEFLVQLGVFGIIAGALLVLNVFQRWLAEMLKVRLREGLTTDLVDRWMFPRRAFRLASAGRSASTPTSACTRMRVA